MLPVAAALGSGLRWAAEDAAFNADWRKQARSLKGALIHIGHVHPAICHGVSCVCQFMATPTRESHAAAKRILAWLKQHESLGVTYGASHIDSLDKLKPPASPPMPMDSDRNYSLHCIVDSDLPTRDIIDGKPVDPGSHRPQLGYAIMLAGGCIEGTSRRQHSTAVDTAAAETFATSSASAVCVTVANVLEFLSFGILGRDPVVMWCDNEAAVCAGNDATSIKRLAYIARRVRFLQELVSRLIISLLDVPGTANPADAFTKHVAPKRRWQEYMARMYNTPVDMLAKMTA